MTLICTVQPEESVFLGSMTMIMGGGLVKPTKIKQPAQLELAVLHFLHHGTCKYLFQSRNRFARLHRPDMPPESRPQTQIVALERVIARHRAEASSAAETATQLVHELQASLTKQAEADKHKTHLQASKIGLASRSSSA